MSNLGVATNIGGVWLEVTEWPAGYTDDGGITGAVINDKLNVRIKMGVHNIQEVGIFADGSDQSARFQTVVNNPKCKILEFHIDGGGDVMVNGIVTMPAGFVLKFSPGVRLTGTGKIIYGLIDADENQHIFAGSVQTWIEGSVTGRTSVKWWGAKGDGIITAGVGVAGTDDTTAIQRCFNQALYFNYGATSHVHFPMGIYRTTTTIHVGYGFVEESSFHGLLITGARSSNGTLGDVLIYYDSLIGSCFNIQGARGVYFEHIGIQGDLHARSTPSPYDGIYNDPGIWFTNLPATWDYRFRPYCAISTDAYSGAAPVGSGLNAPQPDVIFPADIVAATGQNYQYGKKFSSFCSFSYMTITGFVAGIVINPSNAGTQNDYMTCHKVFFTNNVYGFSSGAPNCRDLNMHDCVFIQGFCGVISSKHGSQQGGIGILNGCQFSYLYKILDISTSYSGSALFKGCTGEGLGTIGNTGGNSFEGLRGVTFDSCQWNFTHAYGLPAGYSFKPSWYETTLSGRYTKFLNCTLFGYSVLVINGSVDFEGCSLWPTLLPSEVGAAPTVPTWYTEFLRNTTGAIIVINGKKTGRNNGIFIQDTLYGFTAIPSTTVSHYADDTANWLTGSLAARYLNDMNIYMADYVGGMFKTANSKQPVRYSLNLIEEVNPQSFTLTNKTVSFSLANSMNSSQINPGDLCAFVDTNGVTFVGVVMTKATLALTVQIMNNFYRNAAADFTGWIVVPNFSNYVGSPNTGSLYFQSCRRWFTSKPLYGDVAAGSASVTNIRDGNGAPATGLLRVDDCLAGGYDKTAIGDEITNKLKPWQGPVRITVITDSTTITVNNTPSFSSRGVQLFNAL